MKRIIFFFSFLLMSYVVSSQESPTSSRNLILFGKENPTRKEIKKTFRQLKQLAPNRMERKKVKALAKEYYVLLEKDKIQLDSIQAQKEKIKQLLEELETSNETTIQLDKLRAETDSLKAVMRAYVIQIDSLNTVNERLKTALQTTGDYYFNLANFTEPKIYFFHNTSYPLYSEYWRMYSIPDSNILVTEGYDSEFQHINTFVERYDSIGSKVVEHIRIIDSDTTFSEIGPAEVCRWNSAEEYAYTLNFAPEEIDYGYTKKRQHAGIDSMEIMGEMIEVIRFQDTYSFFSGERISLVRMQQSFYSKEYGLVRFLQFDQINKENETFLLKTILSEEEWQKLIRKN